MKSVPFAASRAAAVAMHVELSPTPAWSDSARKRRSPSSARCTASGSSWPRRDDAAAKTGQHLLVEQHGRRAGDALIDDQADGVRADVDDGQRPAVLEPALRVCDHAAGAASLCWPLELRDALGRVDFSACRGPTGSDWS